MTKQEFRDCFDFLDWSFIALAHRFGVSERQVRRWYDGEHPVPQRVAEWMQFVADFLNANRPEKKTRKSAK